MKEPLPALAKNRAGLLSFLLPLQLYVRSPEFQENEGPRKPGVKSRDKRT